MSVATIDETVAANLADIRTRIARAAQAAGRQASDVRLIAVSKTFTTDHVRAAVAAGQLEFGENRVQEALDKIPHLTDLPIKWHLIGHLQRNKVRKAVGPFVCIHSVDSVEVLRRIDGVAAELGITVETLVQVDLAGEATKHGADEAETRRILVAAPECKAARVVGLMLLPPLFENPEDVRPFFVRLRSLRDDLAREGIDPTCLRELSMGMSHDFEVAVQEHATIVRVGSAIFGARHV